VQSNNRPRLPIIYVLKFDLYPKPICSWNFQILTIWQAPYIALNKNAADIFYHDVPEPLFSQYARLLGKQPAATFATPVVHAGWRSVPSTYVYTRQDRPLPLLYQEFMAKRAQRVASQDRGLRLFEGEMGEVYIDSGHTPFLSMTEEMGNILIRAAESSV